MSEAAPGHGGNSGLCSADHFCPGCETGNPCPDGAAIFSHPICGDVACCTSDIPPARTIPTAATLLAGSKATTASDAKVRWDRALGRQS